MQQTLLEKYRAISLTDVGCLRDHNEDNVLIDEALGLLLVADGMGGHQAGEVASLEAINVIQKMLISQQSLVNKRPSFIGILDCLGLVNESELNIKQHKLALEKALHEANYHVFQLNVDRNADDGTGMGTTIAGCWIISENTMLVFHIGDSRIYRFKNQKIELLSKDHSVLQAWYDNGSEGEKPRSNMILNAVGPYSEAIPDIQVVTIEKEDSFLICSDGLTDMLNDEVIERTLQGLEREQLEQYSQKLLQAALDQGGKDNVSIILLSQ